MKESNIFVWNMTCAGQGTHYTKNEVFHKGFLQ